MTRIGVLSDTHVANAEGAVRLRALCDRYFRDADILIHAGDVTDEDLLHVVSDDRPVYAVRGNMDGHGSASSTLSTRQFRVEGVRIAVVHGHGYSGRLPDALVPAFPDAGVIVYGHTHKALCEERDGVLLFNPGSPWQPRDGVIGSVGRLVIEGDRVRGEIIRLNRGSGA